MRISLLLCVFVVRHVCVLGYCSFECINVYVHVFHSVKNYRVLNLIKTPHSVPDFVRHSVKIVLHSNNAFVSFVRTSDSKHGVCRISVLITPVDSMSCLREMETFCFQALSETIYSRSSDCALTVT